MAELLRNAKRQRTLRPVRPNAGTEAAYRARLLRSVAAMARSVEYWLASAYRNNQPRVAQDATPADLLQRVVRQLRRQWTEHFDQMADDLAAHFAQAAETRSTAALKKILKDAGWSVKFKMTSAQRDVVDAIIHENVSLIKSIPAHYLDQVEGLVMRSVSQGRDLGALTQQLQKQHGVTRRRAQLIARDQNNKAFAMLNRARQRELGITRAEWQHSSAGKHPRPSHVKMDGKTYDVKKGMWDPTEKKYVLPGELINCRCFSRPVIEGL
jgi:SPP1 gp7 family putative phage head morphogenesis protein